MANQPAEQESTRPTADQTAAKPQSPVARFSGSLDRHLSKKWLAILLGLSVLGHGLGLAAYRLRIGQPAEGLPDSEISLGAFQFIPEQAEGSPVLSAEFSLHIAPLEDVEKTARYLLSQRKYRVQEGVEELLRRAHGGDFRDPDLSDLKQQLQERVNQALGMRAISEVIITDLEVHRPPLSLETADTAETAESEGWGNRGESAG